MKQISFTSIGDCCVDVYPDHNKIFLGGTAFNTAFHAAKAGARASIVSAIGTDGYGRQFLSEAKQYGIDTSHLHQERGVTSSVQIPLDAEGKPMFAGWDLGVLSDFRLTKEDAAFVNTQDIVKIIYLKPLQKMFDSFIDMRNCHSERSDNVVEESTAPRMKRRSEVVVQVDEKIPPFVRPLLSSPRWSYGEAGRDDNIQQKGREPLLICDFAGGSQYSVVMKDVEKYAGKFAIIFRSVSPDDKKELSSLRSLSQQYKTICLTLLGSQGSIAFHEGKKFVCPAISTHVTDTTGAGDAYIANFAIVYFQTKDIQKAMEQATKAASVTITHFGSTKG